MYYLNKSPAINFQIVTRDSNEGHVSTIRTTSRLFGRIARLPCEVRHMKFTFTAVILLILGPLTQGANLEDVYRAARDNDPVLGQAVAGRLAQKQTVVQSRASLLPTVSASGSKSEQTRSYGSRLDMNPASPTFGQTYRPEDEDFEGHNWSVNLRQPIVNVANWFNWRSAKALSSQADSDYQATELALYTRVAEAYLNVLRAQARLDSTLASEQAVKRQLEQTQQRFDVGLVAITDVLEATAAYDNAIVNRIQFTGDQGIYFESLTTITGIGFDTIDGLSTRLPIVNPDPRDENEWTNVALTSNPQLQSAREALRSAESSLRSRLSGHLPTVDFSAGYNESFSGGLSFYGNRTSGNTYSLSASLPIFQGGAVHSRFTEQRHRVQQSKERVRERELTTARDTRNFFRAVSTDVARVEARLKAIKSRESALEAVRTGYEVGTRNIVELLQAQQNLFSSQYDYADSRYNYVLNLLRLKQTTGVLSEEDILEISAYTDTNNPVQKITTLSGR